MRSHGDAAAPTPSPHFGPPVAAGKTVFWPLPQATVCASPDGMEGSQQSALGLKVAEPRAFVPPPEAGQLIDGTRPVIPQEIEAAVGIALIAVEPSFCIPNCPSKVSKLQVSWTRPTPNRTTVLPLPLTSQASPMRGSKSCESAFHIVLTPACPC